MNDSEGSARVGVWIWAALAVAVGSLGCGGLDGGSSGGGDASCDPRETAREEVGSIDEVAPGSVDVDRADGVYSGSVEAKAGGGGDNADSTSFPYIDLDEGKRLDLSDADAFQSEAWDVAIKRTEIRLNSADSGPGSWRLSGVDRSWGDLQTPPDGDTDWRRDDFVSDDCSVRTYGREYLQTAFGKWYNYNLTNHEVSAPENAVYALEHPPSNRLLKFEIESYSDAVYRVRWTEI